MTNSSCTVREATYDFLRRLGVDTIFGNPGSTELPMFRDFPTDFRYVLGLQEAVVVGMADGHAQASGRLGVVNLHSAVGVGHAMGNIYTARKNQTPLLIIAGQQSRSLLLRDPYLFSEEATELPKPHVKWSVEPARAADVPAAIARAAYTALAEPCGPVLVSVPVDDWDQPALPVPERQVSRTTVAPPSALQEVAQALGKAQHVALVLGASVDRNHAAEAARKLAEHCRASVFAAPFSARCSFPETHPQFMGFLPANGELIHQQLQGHDLVLVLGAPAFTYHVESECPTLPEGARLIQITESLPHAAMAEAGDAVLGNVGQALHWLAEHVIPGNSSVLRQRPIPPEPDRSELSVALALQQLAQTRQPHELLVEEAPTSRVVMHQYLPIEQPGTFFTMASGGLGWGLPAAVGIAMARPNERVWCVIGDGSTMYSLQALWTAVQYQLNLKVIVLNNQNYAALRRFARVFAFPEPDKLVGTTLGGLDFVALAQGQQCPGELATTPAELADALKAATANRKPYLVEVKVP